MAAMGGEEYYVFPKNEYPVGLSYSDVREMINDKLWICPRCGLVYARSKMNGATCCRFCWTEEDQIALDAKKEEWKKQLQEIDKELEEYHRNKLKDMI